MPERGGELAVFAATETSGGASSGASLPRRAHAWAYVWTWLALLVLSCITFGVSLAGLGGAGTAIGLAIAAMKSLLIAIFFMHLVEQRIANAYVLIAALTLVSFLVALSAADVLTRGHTPLRAPAAPAASAPRAR
jgi:cytochrome c oxidase subunit 4